MALGAMIIVSLAPVTILGRGVKFSVAERHSLGVSPGLLPRWT